MDIQTTRTADDAVRVEWAAAIGAMLQADDSTKRVETFLEALAGTGIREADIQDLYLVLRNQYRA